MKFRPLVAELFHVNGQTDTHRHDEANSSRDTPTRKFSVTSTIIRVIKSSDISNNGPQCMMQDAGIFDKYIHWTGLFGEVIQGLTVCHIAYVLSALVAQFDLILCCPVVTLSVHVHADYSESVP